MTLEQAKKIVASPIPRTSDFYKRAIAIVQIYEMGKSGK